jgi:hypothetical protein
MAKYECGYCGRLRPAEQLVYSRWTGQRYCGVEMKKCDERGARLRRRRKKEEASSEASRQSTRRRRR